MAAEQPGLYDALFALYDREKAGVASEPDVLAALNCVTHSETRSQQMLERMGGNVDRAAFEILLEALVDMSMPKGTTDVTPSVRQAMLVKLSLAILRDYERRSTRSGQFLHAATIRDCMAEIRSREEARQYKAITARQEHERTDVKEAQALEVSEFSSAWKASLAEHEESVQV